MATWDRYTNTVTGFEVRARVGAVHYPREFCDDPLGGLYLDKDPICKLKMTPKTQFVNTNIAWDISESSTSTDTIDTFDITWGGTTDIGNLAAQDWSSDPLSGNVQYTTVGTYTVQAYVTDVSGNRSKVQKIEINIVSYVNLQRLYIGTTDGGCYILTPSTGPTAANTGLTGNHANFRSLRLNPHFSDLTTNQQHLWAATEDGVAYTVDGANSWSVISKASLGTPTNSAGDSPAPTTSDIDPRDIAFCPQDPQRVYVTCTTATRTWLYYTDDYGATWSNIQVGIGL